ncbi:cystathionine beta-lyase [Devosia sp.]|uniref:cystathionine beta-lyase n=1 Tax=Devosia sp. TaxID=1871048 RepID=UPI003A95ABAC
MSDTTRDAKPGYATETILTHSGRRPPDQFGFVNTPVYRGSTVLFESLDAIENQTAPYGYGRVGNPTSRSVETLISELEGAEGTVLAPSGLAAITTAMLAVLSTGDDVLVTDTVYDPTRRFCDGLLARMGITTRYYDPRIGAGIEELMTDKTRLIFCESPGSLTFEIQDLPAISEVAKRHGALVMVDNSWASPLFYRPLALGADIVVHAGTKMFVGHSDAMFGTASANAAAWKQLYDGHRQQGMFTSPDDVFLAARGLRTLAIRMKEHQARALELARWLEQHPLVEQVLHPALESHPDNALFKRDFSGSGSLFSIVLENRPRAAVAALVDGLELFGMGYSWGGYESLFLPIRPHRARTVTSWPEDVCMFRIHVGLEDIEDLKADLSAGLDRYAAITG